MVSNRNLLFQVSIFGCHVSFRGCSFPAKNKASNVFCSFLFCVSIIQTLNVWSIYLHEWLILMVNVGKYTIHGSYGFSWWCFYRFYHGKLQLNHHLGNIFNQPECQQILSSVACDGRFGPILFQSVTCRPEISAHDSGTNANTHGTTKVLQPFEKPRDSMSGLFTCIWVVRG